MNNIVFSLALGLVLGLSGCFLQPAPQQTKRTPAPLESQALSTNILGDFEGTAPSGFFVFNGASSVITSPITAVAGGPLALPGQTGDNGVLETTFNITDFGGFGQDLNAGLGGPQDWSGFDAIGFWFYGTNSGLVYQTELQDNRSDPNTDTAERWDVDFTDSFSGWRFLTFPFATFARATDFQPGGAPDDGLGLTEVWGWAFVLPQGNGNFYLDEVSLLGGEVPLKVGFAAFRYSTEEGTNASITVALTKPSDTEVRVDYATSSGSAAPESDYRTTSGTLVFAAGETQQSFTVQTLEDTEEEGPESLTLTLSNPVNVELGSNAQTTLTIEDDDFTVPVDAVIVDDFEAGLPRGQDGSVSIGFVTFQDGNSSVALATTQSPPAPVPGGSTSNSVLQLDLNVSVFAGFIHSFENETADTWVTQDWSAFEGLGFWLYGTGSGTDLFVDIVDNRNPGSSVDDAERYSVAFKDNFSGWRYIKLPFADFTRKEIGNGAPNDGLGLTEVHGWAFGTLNTRGSRSYYIDDAGIYGTAPFKPLAVSFSTSRYDIPEGSSGDITIKLNRAMGDEDPASVSVRYTTEPGVALPNREYTPVSGTLTFVKGGDTQQTFSIRTFDDTKFEGDERIVLRLSNPQGAEPGIFMQASAFIADNDAYDPDLTDDFERGAYLWEAKNATLNALEVQRNSQLARPGQDAYEAILEVIPDPMPTIRIQGTLCSKGKGVVTVQLLSDRSFSVANVNHESVRFGGAAETHRDAKTGGAKRHEEDVDRDGDTDLVFHFRVAEIEGACGGSPKLTGQTFAGDSIAEATAYRDFALGQDWSDATALSFWYYGAGNGQDVTVQFKDNRAPDPGPSGWNLVWSDEFNEPAGTPPNPEHWSYEIGDVTPDGKNGWGNDELQYYTDDPANAATDGQGNLVITARDASSGLKCYYGPCEYTSARLISWHKAEFAYGRIESRIKVPQGAGLWPAFWSLGTDIDVVSWPQTGEIDFMEFVGRLPNEIFGTIHGPGYAGGQSFGGIYDFGRPVYTDYHTFVVEWEPNRIVWYVDGIKYHEADPADVAPNQWVFNDPVFLLLNVAIGGNFGGAVGADTTFPQAMKVDYVRVYQGPDTAERFETTFSDDVSGWQKVTLPFNQFVRSANQPTGAPSDGLNLRSVWGYGFTVNDDATFYLDQISVQ
jgi:beta-glucanase (GH16 family)